jgi:hypothetical protein
MIERCLNRQVKIITKADELPEKYSLNSVQFEENKNVFHYMCASKVGEFIVAALKHASSETNG